MLDWPLRVRNGPQVHWTLETEKALTEKGNQGVYDYYEQIKSQLADMVVLIRTGLSSNQRTTVGALAVIDVHARDVMKAMADAGVSESTDFDWQSVTQRLLNFNFAPMASTRRIRTVTPSTSEPRPCRDGVRATQVADAFLLGGVG